MIGLHVKHLLPFNYTLLGQVYNNETPLIQVELILGNFNGQNLFWCICFDSIFSSEDLKVHFFRFYSESMIIKVVVWMNINVVKVLFKS